MGNLIRGFIEDADPPPPSSITIGVVVGIGDGNQLGRIQVRCASWGDAKLPDHLVPWARYCSSFAGTTNDIPRGRDADKSVGTIAYGQWMIPEVGSRVITIILDNDPNQRYWIGAAHDIYYSHTMPHGRFLEDKLPRTSSEELIQPLARNLATAFNSKFDSPEYATRGMDRQVSGIKQQDIGDEATVSKQSDELDQVIESYDGSTIKRSQGYSSGIVSALYSQTTPGFHSFSMDDDLDHCRIKLRTTSGHQIIMDDTNERIYISTAQGKTWIEIDEKGTIDIYGSQDISLKADGDLNLSAKKTIRMSGGEGVHIASATELRMHSGTDTHIRADGDIKSHTTNLKLSTDENMEFKVGQEFQHLANSMIINSESSYDLDVVDIYTMKSSDYEFDGTNVNVNSGNVVIESGNLSVGSNANISGVARASTLVSSGVVQAASAAIAGGVSASGISASGSISSSGSIATAGDVIAGGVSLGSHTHVYIASQQPIGPANTASAIPTSGIPSPTPSPETPLSPETPIRAPANPAISTAAAAAELPAYAVSRAPTREPYTRSYLDRDRTDKDVTGESALDVIEVLKTDDVDSILEYESTNKLAGTGSSKRGIRFNRNARWRR